MRKPIKINLLSKLLTVCHFDIAVHFPPTGGGDLFMNALREHQGSLKILKRVINKELVNL